MQQHNLMKMFINLFAIVTMLQQVLSADKIRIQRNFYYPIWTSFPVYWNVPTFMCKSRGIDFTSSLKRWEIRMNPNDNFRGDVISILYDPGLFPAMLQEESGRRVERNGGIPQLGNITRHLDSFRNVVEQLVPHDFTGVGVIDFEAWRPVFRQNWNDQAIYLDMSEDLERQKHPQWDNTAISVAAKKHFNDSARVFLENTLKLAKILRPKAVWGYYGYPFCYNFRQNNGNKPWCHHDVEIENNRIQWLFDESTALYPSLYLSKTLNLRQQQHFVIGRLNEAWRLSSRVSNNKIPPVHPYLWYKFSDSSQFVPKDILQIVIETTMKYKMGGLVIWGATNDVRTSTKCQDLLSYLNNVLGPTLESARHSGSHKLVEEYTFQSLDTPSVNLTDDNSSTVEYYSTPKNSKRSNPGKSNFSYPTATPLLKEFMKWYEGVIKALLNVR